MRDECKEAVTGFALAVFVLLIVGSVCRADEDHPPTQAGEFAPSDEAALIYEEAQRLRIFNGLGRQEHDQGLASIAQRVANYQASRDGMCHTSLGDNVVAYGATPRGMVTMWLGSPPHRAFVLGGAKFCGYGFARSATGTTYAAGIFRDARAEIQDANDMSGIGGASGGRRRWRFWR